LAFLRVLVLPFGAIVGPRIVLNGITGNIELYDAANVLVGQWNPTDGFRILDPDGFSVGINTTDFGAPALVLSTNDPDQMFPSVLASFVNGVGGIRQLGTSWSAPVFAPAPGGPGIGFLSESEDGTQEGFIFGAIRAGYQFALPMGRIHTVEQAANDALVAVTEELCDNLIINDRSVIRGRGYRIEGEATFDNVTTRVIFRLRYTEDGSVPTAASPVLKVAVFNTVATGTTGGTGRIVARYIPSTNLNLSIGLFLESNAGITAITTIGGDPSPGFLAIDDTGQP
jgi:hypothetical protein